MTVGRGVSGRHGSCEGRGRPFPVPLELPMNRGIAFSPLFLVFTACSEDSP